jgi:hypothetical protein
MIYIQVVDSVEVNRIVAGAEFIATQPGEWLTESEYARMRKRHEMRQSWVALPEWIRGPYRPNFDAANNLLDELDDTAALSMIASIQATAYIIEDATRIEIFRATKAAFTSSIEALAE